MKQMFPANTSLSARCRFDAVTIGNVTRAIDSCRPNCDFTISGRLRKIVIGPTPIPSEHYRTVDSNRGSYDANVGVVTIPTCRADGWPALHKHTTPDAFMSIRRSGPTSI